MQVQEENKGESPASPQQAPMIHFYQTPCSLCLRYLRVSQYGDKGIQKNRT